MTRRWYEGRGDCLDCGINTIESGLYYMLHDQIWAASGLRGNVVGMLCLRCLERRLGRELALGDFIDDPHAVPSAWDTFRRDEPHISAEMSGNCGCR